MIQQKTLEADSRIETVQGLSREQKNDIVSLCADIASTLTAADIPETKEHVVEIVSDGQLCEQFLARLESEYDTLLKKVRLMSSQVFDIGTT